MLKKICALGAALILSLGIFAGCGNEKTEDVTIANFTQPEPGEKIAVLHIKDYGDIKIKFFPEQAPKAVENFIGLSEMGYYDELKFHRVIENFMIQGGDPKGDGTGGNSIWGKKFEDEFSDQLYNFTGSVACANSGANTNGSQFFISSTGPLDEEYLKSLESQTGTALPQSVKDKYKEAGGNPHLDGRHTVFGQVFEGMEVVDKIYKVPTDANDAPKTKVEITSVEIVEYQK